MYIFGFNISVYVRLRSRVDQTWRCTRKRLRMGGGGTQVVRSGDGNCGLDGSLL